MMPTNYLMIKYWDLIWNAPGTPPPPARKIMELIHLEPLFIQVFNLALNKLMANKTQKRFSFNNLAS